MEAKADSKVSKFEFIDSIRWVSMIAIVMEHSTLFWGQVYPTLGQQMVQTCCLQFFKYGTIIFFLLSGFLIGDKFETYNSKEYFFRRLNNTFKPWLFWVFFQIGLFYLDLYFRYKKFGTDIILQKPVATFFQELLHVSVFTSFWFIINFMVCIGILLMFRKYINSYKFGIVLCIASLFYSVNLYFKWIITDHTAAFFGYIFYLWMGYQLNKNYPAFINWAKGLSNGLLLLLFAVTYALSCAESINLIHLGSDDAFNTLRISNILFSLVCFVILFKFSDHIKVQWLKPRQTTFGVYLIHETLVFYLMPLIFTPLGIDYNNHTPMGTMVLLQLFRFAIVYTTAYLMSLGFGYAPKKIRWIVGQ
jgi:hypothetical protein